MVLHTQKTKKTKAKARVLTAEEREHAPLLRDVAAAVAAVKRRDAEQSYELGEHLARAKDVLPEKALGAWVKENCGFTPRLARSYIAVHTHLQAFRSRLVAAAVKPTILLTLANADIDKVGEVVEAIEAGGRLSVVQVKRMLKPDAVTEDAVIPAGGRQGLMRAAHEKLKTHTAHFAKEAAVVLKQVEVAVTALQSGKHVAKSALFDKLGSAAGRARDHLSNAVETEADRDWKAVSSTLGRLSDLPRWPGRAEFPDWLVGEVLPRLRFAVLGASETPAPNTSPGMAEVLPVVASTEVEMEDDDVVVTSHLPAMIAGTVLPTVPGVA
jgi:hypothetical protein